MKQRLWAVYAALCTAVTGESTSWQRMNLHFQKKLMCESVKEDNVPTKNLNN